MPLAAGAKAELDALFRRDAHDRLERLASGLEALAAGRETDRDPVCAEAHSSRGAASSAGHDDIAELCLLVDELLAEEHPEPEELLSAARLVRSAQRRLASPDSGARPLRRWLVPRRVTTQLGLVVVLAVLPALGLAAYEGVRRASDARERVGSGSASVTDQLLRETLLVGGCGLAGLLLALVAMRLSLLRSLRRVIATSRRIGDGDLSARTGAAGRGGELGQLAASVDAMAEELQRRTKERERAIADLGRLAAELEQRVHDRTVNLEETSAAAERSTEAKSVFLSLLSHELRTPLHAVRGFSKLLLNGDLKSEEREFALHVSAAGEHMIHLVDDLLDTAGIEAGQFRVDLEPVPVAVVVDEVIVLSAGGAAEHEVSLTVVPVAGLGVLADRQRLSQALLNLVTNAIAYNRRGGSVVVRAERASPGRVTISVLDTGQGIAEEDQAHVFRPFDRLGRGAESGGLGLGLALSRRIVEAMGGTIGLESEPGVGTRFWIELAEADVPTGVRDAPAPSRTFRRRGEGARLRQVLCVDDDATSMKLVELILRGRGVELLGATTGAEGLRVARLTDLDLVLLDLQLPDTSGEDVLRAMRREHSLRSVPIVIVSADASRASRKRLLEAGADDYLTKPLEVDRAADLIEWFLRGAERRHERGTS